MWGTEFGASKADVPKFDWCWVWVDVVMSRMLHQLKEAVAWPEHTDGHRVCQWPGLSCTMSRPCSVLHHGRKVSILGALAIPPHPLSSLPLIKPVFVLMSSHLISRSV